MSSISGPSASSKPAEASEKPLREQLSRLAPATAGEGVHALEEEAEFLAGRLAETGSSAALGQLSDMIERYGAILKALEEADTRWLATLKHDVHAFSD